MFSSNILALGFLAISGAFATDVYSTFYSENGQIAPNFDIANNGCFTAENADMVSFSQSGGSHFNGPYCLSAFIDGGCPGDATATQGFSSLDSGTHYALNPNVAFAGSFRWAVSAC